MDRKRWIDAINQDALPLAVEIEKALKKANIVSDPSAGERAIIVALACCVLTSRTSLEAIQQILKGD